MTTADHQDPRISPPDPWATPPQVSAVVCAAIGAPLDIGIRNAGSTTMLRLRGELDMSTADTLRRHISVAINAHDPHRLLLDLSELTFVDAIGLAVFVWAHRVLGHRGRQLRLYRPRPQVLRVLVVTGLHTRLPITSAPGARVPTRRVRSCLQRTAPARGRSGR